MSGICVSPANPSPLSSGFFIMPQEPVSAWLGWFGILEKYRRRGYGSLALEMFEAEARKRGYLFARLYTGRFHNDAAKAFFILKINEPWEVTDFSATGIRERPINRDPKVRIVTSHGERV